MGNVFFGGGKVGMRKPSNLDANTLLMLHGDDLTDSSPFQRTITNSGVEVSSNQSKFGGKSLYFDGAAMLLLDPIDFGNSDFTIDWWEYVTNASSESRFCSQYTTGASTFGGLLLGFGGTAAYAGSKSEATSWDILDGVELLSNTLNTWVHWAIVRSGNTLKSYKNGVLYKSTTISGSIGYTETIDSCIGEYRAGHSAPFTGYIDEFRISDVARWTNDFTPPTAAY